MFLAVVHVSFSPKRNANMAINGVNDYDELLLFRGGSEGGTLQQFYKCSASI